MQHLGPGWPTGKWIMIIWRLEQQRHTQAHRLISDQLAARLSLPCNTPYQDGSSAQTAKQEAVYGVCFYLHFG